MLSGERVREANSFVIEASLPNQYCRSAADRSSSVLATVRRAARPPTR